MAYIQGHISEDFIRGIIQGLITGVLISGGIYRGLISSGLYPGAYIRLYLTYLPIGSLRQPLTKSL